MSKRSRRLGKKNELRAVEEAIGASLGKSPAQVAAESEGAGGKTRRNERASKGAAKRWAADKK